MRALKVAMEARPTQPTKVVASLLHSEALARDGEGLVKSLYECRANMRRMMKSCNMLKKLAKARDEAAQMLSVSLKKNDK
jgi:hypothetical protein